MNNNCIEIIGLNFLNIFNNFSIAIEKEKFITISGANNCGKTTLIRIIDGQLPIKNTIMLYGSPYENYKITELSNIVQTIIPLEVTFYQNTVEDELLYQMSSNLSKTEKASNVKEIAKNFKLTKILTKSVENLRKEEIVSLQLALAFIKKPKIILIDDLYPYYNEKELIEITNKIKDYGQKEKITIIMMTSLLDCNLLSDYTYILNEGKIVLEGLPFEVLQKDNVLNKAGLNLPFMMDLSVKLRDYDLVKSIELDMDRLVDTLWN